MMFGGLISLDTFLQIVVVVVGSLLTAAVLWLIRFLAQRDKEFRTDLQLGKSLQTAVEDLTSQIADTKDSLLLNGTTLSQAWTDHQREHTVLLEAVSELQRSVEQNTRTIQMMRSKRRWW